MTKVIKGAVILAILLIASFALMELAVDMERHNCQELGAERVSAGRGYICVTPDGRIVKP